MIYVKHGQEEKRASAPDGFTLVEILVSMAIIGTLMATAVPQFNKFRENAYYAQVKADLHMLAITQEAHYIDSDTYIAITQGPSGESNVPSFRWTRGVVLESSSGDVNNWSATVSHTNCPCLLTYNSAQAGNITPGDKGKKPKDKGKLKDKSKLKNKGNLKGKG